MQARADYNRFCRLFEGMDFNDIPSIVNDNGLTYGAIPFGDDDYLCDINLGTICASVGRTDEGRCFVYASYEVYDGCETEVMR